MTILASRSFDKVQRELKAMPRLVVKHANDAILESASKDWFEPSKEAFRIVHGAAQRGRGSKRRGEWGARHYKFYITARGTIGRTSLKHPPILNIPTARHFAGGLRGAIRVIKLAPGIVQVIAQKDYAAYVEADRPFLFKDEQKRRKATVDRVGRGVLVATKKVFK